jgi:protein phosphatase
MIAQYIEAYQRYCWPVSSIDDYKLAPFHLMATEKTVHTQQTHLWHMETLARLCEADDTGLLRKTPYRIVHLQDTEACKDAVQWWQDRTAQGSEGMVIKPLHFIEHRNKTFLQPALKCRGPQYLRIVYGPEYSAEIHLQRLRERSLSQKRSLALREFALGIEGLQRFVEYQPLRHVHECVFGVLALESEGVDPRL